MKLVVIGGTGRIGSKLVPYLSEQGHEVVAASPSQGINTITGEGLAQALDGAAVVVDVSNSPSYEYSGAHEFFDTSMRNVRAAELVAGVQHHVTLSVVGTDRLAESGYFRAKLVQEDLVRMSLIPYTILRATQFFEFIESIADAATDVNTSRLPPVLFQPMAMDDAVKAVARAAVRQPSNDIAETGGPERFRMDELVRRVLAAGSDPREVVTDPRARYFGARLSKGTLVPGDGAVIGETRFDDWLRSSAPIKQAAA